MSTQHDIYAADFENHPPTLNKDNYVPWYNRLLHYAKSKPNGKLLVNSIKNGPYTDDELTNKEVNQMEAYDQAIQNILIGIVNQNANQNGNGNVVATRVKGNGNGNTGNQIRCYNYRGLGHYARNCIVRPRRRNAAYLQTRLLIAQKEEAGIQLQYEEFDLMVVSGDINEIEKVNTNCILMANLEQGSTSSTQTDKAPVYDSDGSAKVHHYGNCYDNKIFNMFT
nr:hypothetical protein [Tanacetum cinerariifolium]